MLHDGGYQYNTFQTGRSEKVPSGSSPPLDLVLTGVERPARNGQKIALIYHGKKGKVVPIHLADVPGVSEPSGIVLDESQNRLYSTGYHVQGLTDTMKRIKLIPFISGIGQHGIGNFNFDESGTRYLTSSDSRELIQIIKTSNL